MTWMKFLLKWGTNALILPISIFLHEPLNVLAQPGITPDYANGIRWEVEIRTEQSGKTLQTHNLVYSATPTALRIDQPDNKGFDLILWRLDLGKVYAIDTRKKTYREQSIKELLSYQGFSDLIGQHAGSNPGDTKKTLTNSLHVAGYSCMPEVFEHKFRGTVVGMINGDQKTVLCQSKDVKGLEALESFKKNLMAMNKKTLEPKTLNGSASPEFFLSLSRVTHYKTGFIIKILNAIGLYDLSKVPSFEKESSTVQSVGAQSFEPSLFDVPSGFKKSEDTSGTGNAH